VTAATIQRTRLPLAEVFDTVGPARAIVVLRRLLGPAVLLHLLPFVADLRDGIAVDDRYHQPWLGLSGPGWLQYAYVGLAFAGGVALTVGWRWRGVAWVTALGVGGNLFLSETYFRHNRAFLLYLLLGVALGDPGRSGVAPRWPLYLLRFEASAIYFASGFSKLVDRDWVGGTVLWDRSVRYAHLVPERLPGWLADPVVDVVTNRTFHRGLGPVAVATELFLAFGLWHQRTRLVALWVAVLFHVSIEVAASVEVFSFIALGALVIWVVPTERDRTLTVPRGGRWLRRLDLLHRFQVLEEPGPVTVVDRDGTVRTGRAAAWFSATRVPWTFPLAGPVWAASRWRR
jgi:hypothetical protein